MKKKSSIVIIRNLISEEDYDVNGFISSLKYAVNKSSGNDSLIDLKDMFYEDASSLLKIGKDDLIIFLVSVNTNSNEIIENQIPPLKELFLSDEFKELNFPRIFNIYFEPANEHTEFIKGTKNYQFYESAHRSRQIIKYDLKTDPKKIWPHILDVAYDIKTFFAINSIPPDTKTPVVYLGQCSKDADPLKEYIRRELQHAGAKTTWVPDSEPLNGQTDENIHNYLQGCTMIVQIIGKKYGNIISEFKKSAVDYENTFIEEYLKDNPGVQRFVLIPNELNNFDSRQNLFIKRLDTNNTVLLESSLNEFKKVLLENLEQSESIQTTEKISKQAYFLSKSNTHIDLLSVVARENSVALNCFEITTNDNPYKRHLKMIQESDGIFIDCSDNDYNWLSVKIREIIKAQGMNQNSKKKTIAVLCPEEPNLNTYNMWLDEIIFLKNATAEEINLFFKRIA